MTVDTTSEHVLHHDQSTYSKAADMALNRKITLALFTHTNIHTEKSIVSTAEAKAMLTFNCVCFASW